MEAVHSCLTGLDELQQHAVAALVHCAYKNSYGLIKYYVQQHLQGMWVTAGQQHFGYHYLQTSCNVAGALYDLRCVWTCRILGPPNVI